ncbi:hypothetical protein DWV00_29710 [Trinickia dinghuensis]|uniref:Uncharacterized protein n=2 Tax=Trinickia dinghuensis TaxID=2291023 RepID=A0A3D8JR62_9BURK|nr:hypothetical protein DWV00_29710 [Trinickia dinghuensis]
MMEHVTGRLQLSDAIWPVGLQQAGTLESSRGSAKKGLLVNPEPFLDVVSNFAEPLVQVFSNRPPPQWQGALGGGVTSFAYPSFNTIWHGILVHINYDMVNAFQLRLAQQDPQVSPADWRFGWCTVVGSGEQTSQIILQINGPTSWTATAPLLGTPLGSPVRLIRDKPFINYANAENIDLREHLVSQGVDLLKAPSDEQTEAVLGIVRERHLGDEWLAAYYEKETEFRNNAKQV